MSKVSSKTRKRKTSKPVKKRRPLTAQKQIVETNKRLVEYFDSRVQAVIKACNKKLEEMGKVLDGVTKASGQIWNNQQVMHTGLSSSEEHIIVLRRVVRDVSLGFVKRVDVASNDEIKDDSDLEIDWGWYAEQLDFSEDRESFMAGVIVPEETVAIKMEARRVAAEKKEEDLFQANLKALDQITTDLLKSRAEELYPLIGDGLDNDFRVKVREIFGNMDDKLFDATCDMIRSKLENAPSQEEMEAEAAALKYRLERTCEEADKRERGEPYDEKLLAEADAEIAKMEAEENDPYPEGAAIFGDS